jgi:hypothetical protein
MSALHREQIRVHAVDAATISRLAAASPFEQGVVGDLR